MLDKRDHKYMALGIMSGILTIPLGVLIACVLLVASDPMIREVVATNGEATYQLAMGLGSIFANPITDCP